MKSGIALLVPAALAASLGACSSCGNTKGCQSRDSPAENSRESASAPSAAAGEHADDGGSDDPRLEELRQRAFDLLGGRYEIYVEAEGRWLVEKLRPSETPPLTLDELRCPDDMAKIPGRDAPPLAPFCISRTMVTAAEYRACVEAGRCTKPDLSSKRAARYATYGDGARADHPINYIDHEQAATYCAWRGGLVPSMEEWLWSYGSAKNLRFPWGSHIPQKLEICRGDIGTLRPASCPVAAFEQDKTRQGVFDMAGGLDELVRVENSALPRKVLSKASSWPDAAEGPATKEEDLTLRDIRKINAPEHSNSFEFVLFGSASSGFRCAARSATT